MGDKTGASERRLSGEAERVSNSAKTEATNDAIVSARIAASIQHLLDKVAYKEKTRIQLQLSNPVDVGTGRDLPVLD